MLHALQFAARLIMKMKYLHTQMRTHAHTGAHTRAHTHTQRQADTREQAVGQWNNLICQMIIGVSN